MSNAAGFQYFGGPYVTVLSSKTSQRYRLQSDNLASLWLVTQSLESRLAKKFSSDSAPLECSYSSSLPLHEYYSEVEMHFHKRTKLVSLQEQLAQRAAQFRSIEKRLLSRFKDKTPTPLTNLDTLLEGTYRQLQQNTESVEQCLLEVKRSSNNLSCITNLLVFLTRLSTGMNQDEVAKVKAALTPVVHNHLEQVIIFSPFKKGCVT
jgi:Bardet-Biedl syndrome 9 protein